MKNSKENASQVKARNIVDLILIDHQYLKKRFNILKDDDANDKKKITAAKGFLDVLAKHSEAEKKVLYAELVNMEALRSQILEGEIEHEIVDRKVKMLTPKLARVRHLTDELKAELKVLAELVEHHAREEESEMLPVVNRELDKEALEELGAAFMKIRKFTGEELKDKTNLFEVFSQNLSSKVDHYKETFRH